MAKKCCAIGCAVAILALVVVIPVGLFVVAPKVGQNALDKQTLLSIPNSTMLLPLTATFSTATLINKMQVTNNGPLGVTMHENTVTMSTDNAKQGDWQDFATFQFPETSVSKGKNEVDFQKLMTITNGGVTASLAVYLLLSPPLRLKLTGNPKVSALGWPMNLNFEKKLECTSITATTPPANYSSVSMKCEEPGSEPAPTPAPSTSSLEGSLVSEAPADLPDCSSTACPAKCSCAEQKCTKEATDCLADGTCGGGQTCAFACKCGDDKCLAGCAIMHPSPLALPLLQCVEKNCPSEVEAEAPADLPDCSSTACPAKCTCAEQKCTKEATDCLADGTCGGSQTCAFACKCGDDKCLAGCALMHPSPLALPLLQCVEKNCPAIFVV